MLSLVVELLPYIAAFFLLDGLWLLRAGQLALVCEWPGGWRVRGPGLHLVGLLPTAQSLMAFDPPWIPGPSGLCARDGHAVVPWSALAAGKPEGRSLMLVEGRRLDLPSPEAARWARDLGVDLSAASSGAAAAQEAVRAAFDLEEARRRHRAMNAEGLTLAVLASGVWAALFVLVPAKLFWWPEALPGSALALALVALYVLTVAASFRSARRAGLVRAAAMRAVAPQLWFPPAAAHVQSFLWRELMAGLAPLAVLAAMLPAEAFRRQAAAYLRQEDASPAPPGSELETALRWRARALDGLLEAMGTTRAGLVAPVPSGDPQAVSVCAQCGAEYRAGFVRCSDCDALLEVIAAP